MNLLNILLQAGAENPQQGSPYSMIIMLVLMGVVFYFFMIRPQKKQQDQLKAFRDSVQKGDSVMTVGGIHGIVSAVTDTTFVITIAQGVEIAVDKAYVVADPSSAPQATAEEKK